MTHIEAIRLALEALESVTGHFTRTPSTLRDSEVRGEAHKAIAALRQAIAEAGQAQPVAYVAQLIEALYENSDPVSVEAAEYLEKHTSPLPRPATELRKPLTDDEIWKDDGVMAANSGYGATFDTLREIVRAIEAAHGIKENT